MERKDFRSIGRDAQEALHERAVYLVLREGRTQAEAAGFAGVHRQVVNRSIGNYILDKGLHGRHVGAILPPEAILEFERVFFGLA